MDYRDWAAFQSVLVVCLGLWGLAVQLRAVLRLSLRWATSATTTVNGVWATATTEAAWVLGVLRRGTTIRYNASVPTATAGRVCRGTLRPGSRCRRGWRSRNSRYLHGRCSRRSRCYKWLRLWLQVPCLILVCGQLLARQLLITGLGWTFRCMLALHGLRSRCRSGLQRGAAWLRRCVGRQSPGITAASEGGGQKSCPDSEWRHRPPAAAHGPRRWRSRWKRGHRFWRWRRTYWRRLCRHRLWIGFGVYHEWRWERGAAQRQTAAVNAGSHRIPRGGGRASAARSGCDADDTVSVQSSDDGQPDTEPNPQSDMYERVPL